MITIFNRAELVITYDMKRQADVRNILSANNIEYIIRTKSPQTSNFGRTNMRAKTGTLGINQDCSYEYKIYVKKTDFEKSKYLIE